MSDANNRRHPESKFEAEYPYNQSTITRSGHEIHINDTPDKESLRIAHTKGSYAEINNDGSTVVNSVGKAYYYMCDGFSTTVDGHYDLKVKGVMNVNVDGSVSEQTAGGRNMASGDDFKLVVGGVLTEIVTGDKYDSIGGDDRVSVKGSEYKNVGGESATSFVGLKTELLNDDWSVNSGGNIEIVSSGNIRFVCKNFEIEAESITLKSTAGAITISAQSLAAAIQGSSNINSATTTIQSNGDTNLNGASVLANGRPVLTT